jgi:nicotinate-nucleotide--dimethylbenzimidazole phosphoribosyltransferase
MTTDLPTLADIADVALAAALHDTLHHKTKPLGSLGLLEDVALKIGQILGSTAPVLDQPQMVVFARDHGLTARGISATAV